MQSALTSDVSIQSLTLRSRGFAARFAALAIALLVTAGCKRSSELSAQKAGEHALFLAGAVKTDLAEVRQGLPKGAAQLTEFVAAQKFDDPAETRSALERARSKVQDLRVAKSTFFALVEPGGNVLRSDQEHDAVAGKNLFGSFAALRGALAGSYVETRGSLEELASVRGRPDGQWVAATPVTVEGTARALYVTGWSWSAYAYRLENQLRSQIRSGLGEREKEPLVYVYVVVGADVFGAPVAPDVNAKAVKERKFTAAASGIELEITGRGFGLAYQPAPELGPAVGIAVLRSET